MRFRMYFYRLFCKLWETLLRARTFVAYGFRIDPTTILIDHLTPAQQRLESDRAAWSASPSASASRRVLVILPFRDRWSLTEKCLRSLLAQDLGDTCLRIALIDNGSVEPTTAAGIAESLKRTRARVEINVQRIDAAFNFSRLNNLGVAANQDFQATFVLFLNNDIEFSKPGDMLSLLDFAGRCPDLGAVGCTLLYPNGRIQHLFAAPGVKIVAAHPLKGFRLGESAVWFAKPRPVAAVTGAVMLVSARAFATIGGFDEALPTVGQDVDLCLKLRSKGLNCWVVPQVRAVHHEGATRGGAIDKDQVRLIYAKWGAALTNDDCYSSRLSRWSETPLLSLGEGLYPWDKVLL